MRQLQSGWSADREVARRMKTVVVTTVRARVAAAPRTHFAIKMLWPTTPPLDVQLDARLRSGQTISTADVDASRMSGLDLPPDDPSPPAAQAGLLCGGGRSSRVRPNAGDQSSKSLFLWRSNVAVQPGCQRRQQRRRCVAVARSAAVNPKPDMTGTGRDQLAVH